jgi:hypothetical protein
MGRAGLENPHGRPQKQGYRHRSGAESGALCPTPGDPRSPTSNDDPDLALIGTVWRRLPEPARQAIVAMVKATDPDGGLAGGS